MTKTAEAVDRLAAIFGVLSELPQADQALLLREMETADPDTVSQLRRLLQRDRRLEEQEDSTAWPAALAALDKWVGESIRPGDLLGGDVIEAEIGRGGMGTVYLGSHQDNPEAKVAIKLLRGDLAGPLLSDRFAAETRILSSLDHPGIAKFIEAGTAGDGTAFIVMEHVDGIPIDAWCDQSALDSAGRIDLFRQVMAALSHAHHHLVVHRDLKPGNILVTPEGRTILLDFGIAKHLADGASGNLTRTAQRFLTPRFAAPEQLTGGVTGVACDVYSAGCLLYKLLSGFDPFEFEGKSAAEIERTIVSVPPPPMASRWMQGQARARAARKRPAAGLTGDVEHVVQRCLRKDPGERYQSINELDDDLVAVRESRPIRERRSDRLYRARQFAIRNRWVLLSVLGVTLALAVFVVTLIEQNGRLLVERNRSISAMSLLKDAFAMANPLSVSGSELNVRPILGAARRSMNERFRDDPLLYAEMAATLSEIELAIGRYDESSELAALALEAADSISYPPQQWQAMKLLVLRSAIATGDYQRARSVLDEADPDVRRLPGWRLAEGWLLNHLGDLSAAQAILATLVEETESSNPEDWIAMEARLQLVQTLRRSGQVADALALHGQVLDWQRRHLSSDHPKVLLVRLRGLDLLRRNRGAEAAIAEGRSLSADIHHVFGPRSAMAAMAHSSIGGALNAAGRPEEAVEEFRAALAAWREVAGSDNVNVLRAAFNLAQSLSQTEHSAEAEALYADVVGRGREVLGANNYSVLFWTWWQARFLADQGRFEAAFDALSDDASWMLEGDPSASLVDNYRGLLGELMDHMGCGDHPSTRCMAAGHLLESMP